VLGNGKAAVDVLNDLLNYDKIESGTLHLEFSMVAIWEVVGDTFKAFGIQAQQKSISLQLLGPVWDETTTQEDRDHHRHLGVVGDATRIAEVLRNLLSNALKFTPDRGDVTMRGESISTCPTRIDFKTPIFCDDAKAMGYRLRSWSSASCPSSPSQ
jgi:signal transduction histidine kinase